jgi:hypothetical protein
MTLLPPSALSTLLEGFHAALFDEREHALWAIQLDEEENHYRKIEETNGLLAQLVHDLRMRGLL